MASFHQTRQSVSKMMHSTHSSQKQAQASTSHVQSSSILNQQSLMKFAQAHTANFSTQNNLSLARKTQLTTTLVATTQLVRKSLTLHSTESVNLQINAQASKASFSSTPSVVAQAQALAHSSLKDSLLTTARSPSSSSQFTHPHKFQQQSLNHTTPSLQHTQ